MGTKTFGRDDKRTIKTRNTAYVDAPELGEGMRVRVRGMFTGEYADLMKIGRSQADGVDAADIGLQGLYLAFHACVIDDDGEQVFDDSERDAAKSYDINMLQRVCAVAMRLSGLDLADLPDEVREKVEAVQEEYDETDPKASQIDTSTSGSADTE